MANALFDNYKKLLLGDASAVHTIPDMDSDNIKAVLACETGATTPWTPSMSADIDLADITGTPSPIVATSGNMTSPSFPQAGTIDFANFTFSSVGGAQDGDSLVFYRDSGSAATSTLFLYIDTATGLPVTPNGGDITVTLDSNGLFGF